MARRTLRDLPEYDRPREKIARNGAASLSTRELIAAVLGRGIPGKDISTLAAEIEDCIGDSPDLLTYRDLCRIEGMGTAKASQVLSCLELGRRYYRKQDPEQVKVTHPRDILPLVAEIRGRRQEHFVCTTLNGAGEVIETRTITVGLLNHSLVHPREVFADAITDRAASVILIHNHPSGSLEPSPEDRAVTEQILRAGEILGIRVLDHIIVTKDGYLSMKERGLLP